MPEGYLHLTCEQRCQIYALLQSGRSQAHIARQIGVDPSTISRELVRNTGARGCRFKQGRPARPPYPHVHVLEMNGDSYRLRQSVGRPHPDVTAKDQDQEALSETPDVKPNNNDSETD